MTLHATREGDKITVHGNTGVALHMEGSQLQYARITEDYRHVKYFHSQLGTLIEAAEREAAEFHAANETRS